jgi:hypothetical protein
MNTPPDANAFPLDNKYRYQPGFTAREYAALTLRVPDSGTDWLDAMIHKSNRNELAANVAVQVYPTMHNIENIARDSYRMADAMIAHSEGKDAK